MAMAIGAARRATALSVCVSLAAGLVQAAPVIATAPAAFDGGWGRVIEARGGDGDVSQAPAESPGDAVEAAPEVAAATSAPLPAAWPFFPLPEARAITADARQFVVVGSDGGFPPSARAWTSTDGVTWDQASIEPAQENTDMTAVTSFDGGYVAMGTETTSASGGPDRIVAWHSPDGLTWSAATVERPSRKGLGAGVRDVVSGPAGLLALGVFYGQDAGPYRLWRSVDGLTWETTSLPDARVSDWAALVGIPDGYLLVGHTPKGRPSSWRSNDGVSWEAVDGTPWLLDAATGVDGTIVGIDQSDIYVSSDLASWTRSWENPIGDTEFAQLLSVDWDGARFAVVGVDYTGCEPNTDECQTHPLLTSVDGVSWVGSDGPDGLHGADLATWLSGVASLGDTTVVLGGTGPGPSGVWLMDETATEAPEQG